jgi:hypothetical protein
MKNKYRIIKIEKISGAGKIDIKYEIQRKTLFGYKRYLMPILSHHYSSYSGSITELVDKHIRFESLTLAKKILNHLQNPCVELYKGYKITKILYDDFQSFKYYITLKRTALDFILDHADIEFSNNLNDLKEIIDSKIIKTKITTITIL